MNDQVKNKRGISLSTQILIGLTFGLFVGIFFGEKASALAIVGRAYIGLIQMTILPYMVVSLIGGIGHLSYDSADRRAGPARVLAIWLSSSSLSCHWRFRPAMVALFTARAWYRPPWRISSIFTFPPILSARWPAPSSPPLRCSVSSWEWH